MTKFDHRLKRLEAKTGLKKKDFDYWIVSSSQSPAIRNITTGKIPGKMGSRYNPESQNVIILSAVPRSNAKALRSRKEEPIDVAELTDQELDAELARIQKELE